MYYLLIAAAAGFSMPATDADITTVDMTTAPATELTAYDTRRIQYKVRNWTDELNGDQADVYFGSYDNLDACKAARAEIRLMLMADNQESNIRSGCFASKDNNVASN